MTPIISCIDRVSDESIPIVENDYFLPLENLRSLRRTTFVQMCFDGDGEFLPQTLQQSEENRFFREQQFRTVQGLNPLLRECEVHLSHWDNFYVFLFRTKAIFEVRKLRLQLTNVVRCVAESSLYLDPKMKPPNDEQVSFLCLVFMMGI